MNIIYNKISFSPRLMYSSRKISNVVDGRKKDLDIFQYLYEFGKKTKQKKDLAIKRKE